MQRPSFMNLFHVKIPDILCTFSFEEKKNRTGIAVTITRVMYSYSKVENVNPHRIKMFVKSNPVLISNVTSSHNYRMILATAYQLKESLLTRFVENIIYEISCYIRCLV